MRRYAEGTAGTALTATLIVWPGVALKNLGFQLTKVFAAGGLIAVSIGFAMKNIDEREKDRKRDLSATAPDKG